jgi:hypothetical protein
MKYKILIVKNRFKEKLNLNKYLVEWFKKYTPLEITLEEISTDFDVETQVVSNGTFNGVICKNTILPKLRETIPENKYNVVIFIYGNTLEGIRVGVCDGNGRKDFLYKNTSVIQLCKTNDNGRQANHELFHSFFGKLNRNGIILNDNMDTYIMNDIFDVDNLVDTNREVALLALKPYWDKVCSLESIQPTQIAILARKTTNSKQTLGDMIAIKPGDLFLCKTLEREDGVRIPAGTYQCDYTFSPKFQKFTYELREMKSYRIHSGNYFSDTEGCILLGKTVADINKDGILDIANSKVAIGEFESFFGQKSFTLIVI